jgi:hypothetical protein
MKELKSSASYKNQFCIDLLFDFPKQFLHFNLFIRDGFTLLIK